MKTFTRRLALTLALIAPLTLAGCGINAIPRGKNVAEQKFGDLQAAYQRRADLIPNLVETVKGYANQEKSVLVEVTQARAAATQIKVDASSLTTDPAKVQQYAQAQNTLGTALSRLLVANERYPELKSNEQFLSLQNELERTEDRINIARRDYNQAVTDYNNALDLFPTSLWHATMYASYKHLTPFQAEASAQSAPKISFGSSSAPSK